MLDTIRRKYNAPATSIPAAPAAASSPSLSARVDNITVTDAARRYSVAAVPVAPHPEGVTVWFTDKRNIKISMGSPVAHEVRRPDR